MFRSLYNQARLRFCLVSRGSFLVRGGPAGTAGPEYPEVACARTFDPLRGEATVYVPGSSLKGAIRVRGERILRSLRLPACDPFPERGRDRASCWSIGGGATGFDAYRRSCYACRVFGSDSLAGRVRVSDAMAGDWDASGPGVEPPRSELRSRLAIDRVLGSTAFGPFDHEVASGGSYAAEIVLTDFPLWSLALIGLVLRDLHEGFMSIGSGGGRGLGHFGVDYRELIVDTLGTSSQAMVKSSGGGEAKQATSVEQELRGVEWLAKDRIRDPRRRAGDIARFSSPSDGYGDYMEWGRRRQVFTGSAVMSALGACVDGPWRVMLESSRAPGATDRTSRSDASKHREAAGSPIQADVAGGSEAGSESGASGRQRRRRSSSGSGEAQASESEHAVAEDRSPSETEAASGAEAADAGVDPEAGNDG